MKVNPGKVYEISSELIIAMYRSVSADTEPSVAGDPTESLQYILKSLEKLLDSKLDHIEVAQLLNKDEVALSNLAEIYLGLLDLIEESQDARDKSDETNELCLIDDKSDSEPIFESSMPFSPIPDNTATSGPFRTKFPAVLNSSYSGSEIEHDMIEWVPGNQEIRDSSRSEGTNTRTTNSLGRQIERKANENKENEVKPIKVTSRTSEADLQWTSDKLTSLSSANTADLIKCIDTEDLEKNLENLDLSAIEKDSPNSTIVPEEEKTYKSDVAHTTNSTEKLIDTINVIEAEMGEKKAEKSSEKSSTNISDQSIKNLIKAIHQTVDESKAARQKLAVEAAQVERKKAKKSSKKATFNPKAEMEKMLEKEDQLRLEKQKMIVAEYQTQLDDMKQKFTEPIQPAESKVNQPKVVKKTVPAPSAGSRKVKKAPVTSQMKTISKPALEIGEVELLGAIIDEMPGIDHDHRTLRLLHERQVRLFLSTEL